MPTTRWEVAESRYPILYFLLHFLLSTTCTYSIGWIALAWRNSLSTGDSVLLGEPSTNFGEVLFAVYHVFVLTRLPHILAANHRLSGAHVVVRLEFGSCLISYISLGRYPLNQYSSREASTSSPQPTHGAHSFSQTVLWSQPLCHINTEHSLAINHVLHNLEM